MVLSESWQKRAGCTATMDEPITVTIKASSAETALLVKQGPDELMIARLGPSSFAHRRALPALMEALALWFQSRIYVVLCAQTEEAASSTGLVDGLGCGLGTLHFEVDVLLPGPRRAGARLRGLGNLRELRREAGRRGSHD
jgi:hypothetical protein